MSEIKIEELFEIYLKPIRDDIKELRDGQREVIEIIGIQSRQDETIKNLKDDVLECKRCVDKIKDNSNKKIWDIVRICLGGVVGATLAKLF